MPAGGRGIPLCWALWVDRFLLRVSSVVAGFGTRDGQALRPRRARTEDPMKLFTVIGLVGVLAWSARATDGGLVNDGSTTAGLQLLSSENSGFDARFTLTVAGTSANPTLAAAQTEEGIQFFAGRHAWYSTERIATGGVYQVAADFNPGGAFVERRGGVIGWLAVDGGARRGIALMVRPSGSEAVASTLALAVIDFRGELEETVESLTGLYNPDGSAATAGLESAVATLEGYNPAAFATLTLAFGAATAADRAAVPAATARLSARLLQPGQIGREIVLITDIPLPPSAAHRMGYFGYRDTIVGVGPIGEFDNLRVTGEVVSPPNAAPTVSLQEPADGAVYIVPATVLFKATATDVDGEVRRVEFFANETKVGEDTASPFEFAWMEPAAGSYSITARATDDRGAVSTTQQLLDITVRNNFAPVASISSPTNGTVLVVPDNVLVTATAADSDGQVVRVEFFADGELLGTDDSAPYQVTWLAPAVGEHALTVVATDERGAVSAGGAAVAVRIIAPPVEPPTLTIQRAGASVTVSWPAAFVGFTLQANPTVGPGGWVAVPGVTGNSVTVPIEGFARFFRLVGP